MTRVRRHKKAEQREEFITSLKKRVRQLEDALVRADKALEEGVGLADLKTEALEAELSRRRPAPFDYARYWRAVEAQGLVDAADLERVVTAPMEPGYERLVAQELADAINSHPRAMAHAEPNGSTVTITGYRPGPGDVITINGETFRLGAPPTPPRPRPYRAPPRRLDGRRAR